MKRKQRYIRILCMIFVLSLLLSACSKPPAPAKTVRAWKEQNQGKKNAAFCRMICTAFDEKMEIGYNTLQNLDLCMLIRARGNANVWKEKRR